MPATVEIVVPCHNPPVGWAVEFIDKFLEIKELCSVLKPDDLRLTVVFDGPAVSFGEVERAMFSEYLPEARLIFHEKNRGKGHALRTGVAASAADILLLTDADFPYRPASMLAVLKKAVEVGGIVAGFREADYYDEVPLFRKILSKALRFLLENALRLPVADSQCGLKAFDRAGRELFLKTTIDRFLFDLEFLVIASKNPQVVLTPVPVVLRDGVVFGRVGLRVLATELVNFCRILARP